MLTLALFGAMWLAIVLAVFWVIRLGVRYGVDDALRKHRAITRPQPADERGGSPERAPSHVCSSELH